MSIIKQSIFFGVIFSGILAWSSVFSYLLTSNDASDSIKCERSGNISIDKDAKILEKYTQNNLQVDNSTAQTGPYTSLTCEDKFLLTISSLRNCEISRGQIKQQEMLAKQTVLSLIQELNKLKRNQCKKFEI